VFNEFRLQLMPDPKQKQWTAQFTIFDGSPNPAQAGAMDPNSPVNFPFTRAELKDLRLGFQSNTARLRSIGEKVWQSMLGWTVAGTNPPQAFAEVFKSWWARAQQAQPERGLRLAVTVTGDAPPPAGGVHITEVPVELLYEATLDYLGTNIKTPIVRRLQPEPDWKPLALDPPLRLLVVISTHADLLQAGAPDEEQAIRQILGNLTHPGGPIQLDVCRNPTRYQLGRCLQESSYHMLHFIGHGGFAVIDPDPTPKGHIYLHDDDGKIDPTSAGALARILRNTGVRLVVLTTCSSAATSTVDGATDELYSPGALDGVAQQLMILSGQLAAVVAMQFDLEDWAAPKFSESFYSQLVYDQERHLDAVVAQVRNVLACHPKGDGARVLGTPAVYSRCQEGRVFALSDNYEVLSKEALVRLKVLDERAAFPRSILDRIYKQPASVRAILDEERRRAEDELAKLDVERVDLLGQTVRVVGGPAAIGAAVQCKLVLRTRLAGEIGLVNVELEFPADRLRLAACPPAAKIPSLKTVRLDQPLAGKAAVTFEDRGPWPSWPPGEYELGTLQFEVLGAAPAGVADIKVTNATVRRQDQPVTLRGIDGQIFLA
jgi:hypothetical protein